LNVFKGTLFRFAVIILAGTLHAIFGEEPVEIEEEIVLE